MKSTPPKTAAKLKNPPPPGQRHQWMITVGIPLIGNGWEPEEVFKLFRDQFPATGPDAIFDKEIKDIVDGIVAYDPEPSVPQKKQRAKAASVTIKPMPTAKQNNQVSPVQAINSLLDGFRISEEEIARLSPACRYGPFSQLADFVLSLFKRGEHLNIVTKFTEERGKAIPKGSGDTRLFSEWCSEWFDTREVPSSEAGAWIRINPTDGEWIKNENITNFRYFLLEMDSVPIDLQLAFFCQIPLPIVALVKSGANSIHCWVKVDAPSLQDYERDVSACYEMLRPFGIDPANKNPSRLARLPGARRRIGAVGDGMQRLLYLNPNPNSAGILAGRAKEVVCQ